MKYPVNCNTEASRLSFLYKLLQVYIVWFNTRGLGMDNTATQKRDIIHTALNENIAEAIRINFHKVKATHYQNNVVSLPDTVNQNDKGDKIGVLYTLGTKTTHLTIDDLVNYNSALTQAEDNARNSTEWNPTMGDIIDE